MSNLKKEEKAFRALSLSEKQSKIEKWVSDLSLHYEYFLDLKNYIDAHKPNLDEDFLNAVFQIVLNLAKEVKKI